MKRYNGDRVFVDYMYVDHTRLDVCVKTRVLDSEPEKLQAHPSTKWSDIPWSRASVWELDAYKQPRFNTITSWKEKLLKPVALYKDPFRDGRHKMVLCDVMEDATTHLAWTYRDKLIETTRKTEEHGVLMGFEQEYYIYGDNISKEMSVHGTRVEFINHIGSIKKTSLQRKIAEDHINACLMAGLNMYGYNREKARCQWEYQVGPSEPITLADDTVVSRYILRRIAEMYDVEVTLNPFPKECSYPSGLHVNFSTQGTRKEGGLRAIKETIHTLSKLPQEDLIKHYDRHGGRDNAARLTGIKHLPSPNFNVGWGEKESALRVPTHVINDGRGYFEERRPSSDCDPYELAYVFINAAVLGEVPA